MCVCEHIIHIIQLINLLPSFDILGLGFWNGESHQFPGCLYVWVGQCCWLTVVLQSLCPTDQEQVTHPYANQHPTKWFPILWNCARRNFAFYTSSLLEQMFCFQKYTRLHLRLNSNPQGRQQNLSLERNPVDNAEPCFPHDNIVGSYLCGKCLKSNELNVCRKPESIL